MLTPFDLPQTERDNAPPVSREPGPLCRALLATLASATILTLSLAETDAGAAVAMARATPAPVLA